MEFSKQEIESILNEILDDHNGRSDDYDFNDSDYLQLVSEEDWCVDSKYEHRQVIYWSTKHHVHVAVDESRSGSYYSDYYYSEPTVSLVKKQEVQVIKTIWVTL